MIKCDVCGKKAVITGCGGKLLCKDCTPDTKCPECGRPR